jgi:hypothetical protein
MMTGADRCLYARTRQQTPRYGSMGGLLTTATNHARFLIAIMDPGPADAFHLKQASIREMLTPQVKVEDGPGYSISWALGWKVAKTDEFGVLVSHGGDQSGFHSLADVDGSKMGIRNPHEW